MGDQVMGTSLHDDLLGAFVEAGVYDYAAETGILQDGEILGVREHENWGAPASSGTAEAHQAAASAAEVLPQAAGCSEEAVCNGQRLVVAADAAVVDAAAAAAPSLARCNDMEDGAGTETEDDPMQSTPPKRGRKRGTSRGAGSGAGDSGGLGSGGGRQGGKGLRHFSMKVCQKVEGKGRTTYNEVADELVHEFAAPSAQGSPSSAAFDEKNIRRRVYDALNVLMAMDIISKDKKEIRWQGLPAAPADRAERLRAERGKLRARLLQQHAYLRELAKQQTAYRNLIMGHAETPAARLAAANAAGNDAPTPLPLPFILIQVHPNAPVEIQISEDNRQAQFDFQNTCFRILGDEDVLYEMGLHLAATTAACPQPLAAPAFAAPAPVAAPPPTANGAHAAAGLHVAHGQPQALHSSVPGAVGGGGLHGQLEATAPQADAMQESPEARATAPGLEARRPSTPPSTGGSTMAMDLSPGPLLPRLGAMAASQTALLNPTVQDWAARAWPEISAAGGLPGLGMPAGADAGGAPTTRMLQEMLAVQLHPHARAPGALGGAGFPAVPLDGRHL
ncbi:hypothetical protein WJX81_004853 [Elliptochloris bilobata]|uniref:Uncharacterized protein n=1 Tax=Elliptochloris bilobata TaxID=381761 RepID=A0AAW1S1J2_9CHLO